MSADQKRILIVDDEPEVRTLLRTGLEGEGFTVVEAADGASGDDADGRLPIDLVTLDLKLGGEDGLKVARELRAKNTSDDHDHRQGRRHRSHRGA